jgi:hypothetical protein
LGGHALGGLNDIEALSGGGERARLGDLTAAFNRDSTALRQASARPAPRDVHAARQLLRPFFHGSLRAIGRLGWLTPASPS